MPRPPVLSPKVAKQSSKPKKKMFSPVRSPRIRSSVNNPELTEHQEWEAEKGTLEVFGNGRASLQPTTPYKSLSATRNSVTGSRLGYS